MSIPGNTLLTNDIILKTALMEFENNLVLAKTARRDYQDKFDNTTGSTIRIRKPTRYEGRTGRVMQPQPIAERYTQISVSDMIGVDVEVTSQELALQLDDFNREIINPAMVTLANLVDSSLYNLSLQYFNFAGNAGVAPNSFGVVSQAAAVLDRFGLPEEDRFLLLKSDDAASLKTSLYNTFNEKFNTDIIMRNSMGNLSGFDCYSVQNAIRPSSGTQALGSPIVSPGGQSGSSITMTGVTANAVVKAGTLFTIAGVNSLNPTSRTDTGQLWQAVVFADATADGSGNLTVTLGPSNNIILTGPYRNVTNPPAANAVVTFQLTHTKNLFYHREAFAFVSVRLPEVAMGNSAWQKNMVDEKAKVNIRMTRQYQINQDVDAIRFDILPAYAVFPEYGGVLMGS